MVISTAVPKGISLSEKSSTPVRDAFSVTAEIYCECPPARRTTAGCFIGNLRLLRRSASDMQSPTNRPTASVGRLSECFGPGYQVRYSAKGDFKGRKLPRDNGCLVSVS